ncbi:hypothetical protein ACTA71_005218 [Dictyostelium dimigraforme]
MEPFIRQNSPKIGNLKNGDSIIIIGNDIIENENNNYDENKPLLNKKVESKPSIRENQYLKQVFFLYIIYGVLIMSCYLYALFLPGVFSEFVKKNYPNLSSTEQQSKSSYYKSFSDSLPYFTMFLFGPLFGVLSDKYGRKPILLLSFLMTFLDIASCWVTMKTNNLIYFYVGHTIAGLNNVANAAVFSFIADVSIYESHVSLLYSLAGISVGSGIIFGPLIFIYTSGSTIQDLTLYVAACLVILCFLGLPFLSESLEIAKKNNTFKIPKNSLNPFKHIYTLFSSRGSLFWIILLFVSISYTSQDVANTYYYYTTLVYSWTPKEIGLFLGGLGVVIILWGAVGIPILLNYFSTRKVITTGFFISFCCHILMVFSNHSMYYYIIGCGIGTFVPNNTNLIQSLISIVTPSELQGTIITGLQSIGSLAQFFGALASGDIYMYFISNQSHFFFPQAPYLINTIIIFLTFLCSIIIWNYYKNEQKEIKTSINN